MNQANGQIRIACNTTMAAFAEVRKAGRHFCRGGRITRPFVLKNWKERSVVLARWGTKPVRPVRSR